MVTPLQHTLLLWWVVILNKYGETNDVSTDNQLGLTKNQYLRFHKALYRVFNDTLDVNERMTLPKPIGMKIAMTRIVR